jgi:hypothetical protein
MNTYLIKSSRLKNDTDLVKALERIANCKHEIHQEFLSFQVEPSYESEFIRELIDNKISDYKAAENPPL